MASGSGSRDLTRAEQSYAAQIGYQLRHEPEARQHQLLQQARKALLSGRPVDTYSRLEREFGSPADFAHRIQGAALATKGAAGNIYIERKSKTQSDDETDGTGSADSAENAAPQLAQSSSNTALFIIAALLVVVIVAVVIAVAQ